MLLDELTRVNFI